MSPSSILYCDNLSQLIQRYDLIVGISDNQSIIEDLPVSLTYEIAGWSRISRRQKLDITISFTYPQGEGMLIIV